MRDKVISQVKFEIEQIDQLLTSYADLLDRVQRRTPDLVELAALASVLHSFYNGLENVFLSITKGIDGNTPQGPHWHRDLFAQMVKPSPNRGAVLTEEANRQLADCLAFRHFYRHSYSFFLEWDEIANLVVSLDDVWAAVKAQLIRFIMSHFIRSTAAYFGPLGLTRFDLRELGFTRSPNSTIVPAN